MDHIELLEDTKGNKQNLNLTYAVRDGIISHCGEIDENSIHPREEYIDLDLYQYPNQYAPYTWEGCIVKVSDKISYIGRDIEDAITFGILNDHLEELYHLLHISDQSFVINNTVIMNNLIDDLCKSSSPEKGLCFSEESILLMNQIKAFNYQYIYSSDRLQPSNRYFSLVLNEIYNTLKATYAAENTICRLKHIEKFYPNLVRSFLDWINSFWNVGDRTHLDNEILFDINSEKDYLLAIISYISGMTDKFAIDTYQEIISF